MLTNNSHGSILTLSSWDGIRLDLETEGAKALQHISCTSWDTIMQLSLCIHHVLGLSGRILAFCLVAVSYAPEQRFV